MSFSGACSFYLQIGYQTWSPETRLPELTRRRDDENNTNWRPELEESNSKLKRYCFYTAKYMQRPYDTSVESNF